MATGLGIDIGGTASRWVVADDNGIVVRGSAPGATGHLFNPTERDRFRATLTTIAESARSLAPTAAFLGITGLGDTVHADARAIIEELFGIAPSSAGLSDDMELAFRAAFAPGTGHLIAAGTGSIGLHITTGGDVIRVGGRGLLIDDGGSGTWIALTAIREVYRRVDATGGPADAATLAAEIATEIGGSSWDETRTFVYGNDRGRIGTLAQAVARAATKGDPIAADILNRAATELARLAKALIARSASLPIGFVGGIVTLHPSIKPAIEATLTGEEVIFPTIDAAAHAAQMARALQ
jgi:glucosamine kinase